MVRSGGPKVLILVVVEFDLTEQLEFIALYGLCLNPCCSGI